MSPQLQHAIILGELAESKKIKQDKLGRMPDLIKQSCQESNEKLQPDQRISLEIIRMDQFIGLVKNPAEALNSIVLLASRFRFITHRELGIRTELRIALSVGPVEYLQDALRESDGTAVRAAAEAFEEMKRHQRLAITTSDPSLNDEFTVSCGFMDILIHDWSDEQAEAVFLSLSGLNQMQISEALQISQPAVNRRLKASHLDAISRFIDRFKSLMT